MTEFDDALRGALSDEDRAFLNSLEHEDGLFKQMGATFGGTMGPWTVFAFGLSLVFFGLTAFCFYKLFGADGLRETSLWMAGFIWASLAVAMIKLWFWLRMNHLATLRELKKIELRLVRGGRDQ